MEILSLQRVRVTAGYRECVLEDLSFVDVLLKRQTDQFHREKNVGRGTPEREKVKGFKKLCYSALIIYFYSSTFKDVL